MPLKQYSWTLRRTRLKMQNTMLLQAQTQYNIMCLSLVTMETLWIFNFLLNSRTNHPCQTKNA